MGYEITVTSMVPCTRETKEEIGKRLKAARKNLREVQEDLQHCISIGETGNDSNYLMLKEERTNLKMECARLSLLNEGLKVTDSRKDGAVGFGTRVGLLDVKSRQLRSILFLGPEEKIQWENQADISNAFGRNFASKRPGDRVIFECFGKAYDYLVMEVETVAV